MLIAQEDLKPNEGHYSDLIAQRLRRELERYYEGTSTRRIFHPKMIGLVRAELIVEENLPDHLRKGIFSEPRSYPCWIRFSNGRRHPASDKKGDMRGMAIKVLEVEGEKLLEDEQEAKTQDFLLVTSEILQTASVRDFQKAIFALTGGIFRMIWYSVRHLGTAIRGLKTRQKCTNILEVPFFSTTPYLFGEGQAVKYGVFPHKESTSELPHGKSPRFLRSRLKNDLRSEAQFFDFKVQLQTDPKRHPIEVPTQKWDSPFIKVATIRIPPQQFDSQAQLEYGEQLSFTPWHSIAAHRPLGGANRARKSVYQELSRFRHDRNDKPVEEPIALKEFAPQPPSIMPDNTTYVGQSVFNVIIPIANPTPQRLTALNDLLREIGKDVYHNDIIRFPKVTSTHFARWFIIDQAVLPPDKEKVRPHLCFASYFDGHPLDNLRQYLDTSLEGICRIYAFCEGFPAVGQRGKERVYEYLKSHMIKIPMAWTAIRGGTVQQIQAEQDLRQAIQTFLDQSIQAGTVKGKGAAEIKQLVTEFVRGRDDLNWALEPRAKRTFGERFRYYGLLAWRLFQLLLYLPIILVLFIPFWWLLLSRLFEKKDDKTREPLRRPDNLYELLANENVLNTRKNPINIYGSVKKPYWYRRTTLKLGFWLFGTNATYRANKGKLSNIETIVSANWGFWNKNKNIVFFSNYHGAWEIYLSQFVDRAAGPMNVLFGQLFGYLKTKFIFWKGAFDEWQFKTVVRVNSYPCPCFYSAARWPSIQNILNNIAIRDGLSGDSKESPEEWLKRI